MSFWGQPTNAIALVELLTTGEVQRRSAQEAAWETLLELGWARRTRRQGILALEESGREAVEKTLASAWPEREDVVARLEERGLPPTPSGIRELERQQRLDAVADRELPDRMNRRTAAALVGAHSKALLGPFEAAALDDVDVTDDGLVRMRPSVGLEVVAGERRFDGRTLAATLGELVLTDRALRGGTRLAGTPPRAVLTVENLGPYLDAPVPDDVLVVHVPGWNTRTTRDLLDGLADVPMLHFGDLDPNGVAILEHLRRWRPDVKWFVPAFWKEYVPTRSLPRDWPDGKLPADTPDWVRDLRDRGRWLEQEVVVLDGRFGQTVSTAVPSLGSHLQRQGPSKQN